MPSIHARELSSDVFGRANSLVEAADLAAYLNAYQAGTVAADMDDASGIGLHEGGVPIDDLPYVLGRNGFGC